MEFFTTIFLEGQLLIAKGKVVPVIEHCITTQAACDVGSVMLMYCCLLLHTLFLFSHIWFRSCPGITRTACCFSLYKLHSDELFSVIVLMYFQNLLLPTQTKRKPQPFSFTKQLSYIRSCYSVSILFFYPTQKSEFFLLLGYL